MTSATVGEMIAVRVSGFGSVLPGGTPSISCGRPPGSSVKYSLAPSISEAPHQFVKVTGAKIGYRSLGLRR